MSVARVAFGFAALVCSVVCAAQADDVEPGTGLSERDFLTDVPTVLSVSRLAQLVEEAPAPVTVIDREMIKATGFRDLAQVFRLVPGFITVAQRGGFPAVIYGVDDDFARRMQVLVDGRSIYTPSFGGVEWNNLPLEMEDIERIEVIRGPNAAAYGANSFFGVINIITRHAAQDPGAFVSLTKGGNDVEHGVVRYATAAGRLSYRLSAGYHQDGGFAGLADISRAKRLSTRADYQVDDDDALQLQIGYNEGTDGRGDGRPSDPNRRADIDSNFVQLRWQHTWSADSELILQLYRTHYRTRDSFIATVRPDGLPPISFPLDLNNEATRENIEFQHTLRPLDKVRVAWGAEARRDQVRSQRYFNAPKVSSDLSRVFGTAEWRAHPKLIANFGLMWEDNGIGHGGTKFSPRLALNYALAPRHTLRASVSKANRTPVLLEERADTVTFDITTNVPPFGPVRFINRELFSSGGLRPEHISAVELGYVGEIAPGRLSADARIHRDRITDLIVQTARLPLPPALDNVDGARDFLNADDLTLTGFETQIRYAPMPGLRLIANYAYLDVDPKRLEPLSEVVPRHTFALLCMGRVNERVGASFGLYRLTGADWAGGDRLKGTTKLDLRLGYQFKLGLSRAELQLVAQDIYKDYLELERDNERQRRAYVNFNLQF